MASATNSGLRLNDLVAQGELKAPIVIGRDHLDCGSVASPFRETEKMLDGSDAVADWALLNALLNTASGASWVSIHNGGGVGIGYSLHAGQVTVADGTKEMAERIERVLTNDPGNRRGAARGSVSGLSFAAGRFRCLTQKSRRQKFRCYRRFHDVSGATGHTGKAAAEALLARGEKVRVVGRDAKKLEPLAQKGAEAFVGNVEDAASMTKAFEGATAVYLVIPEESRKRISAHIKNGFPIPLPPRWRTRECPTWSI